MFSPGTTLYFLNCPTVDITRRNVAYFATAEAQQAYFASFIVKTVTNMIPMVDAGQSCSVELEGTPGDYTGITYAMWQNEYNAKWYYAFCSTPYISSQRKITTIDLVLDDFMTYQQDIVYNNCLIIKSHVKSDKKGEWLYPEGLEKGEFIIRSVQQIIENGSVPRDWSNCMVLSCSFVPITETNLQESGYRNSLDEYGKWLKIGGDPQFAGGHIVHGLFQGTIYIAAPMNTVTPSDEEVEAFNEIISRYQAHGQVGRIKCLRNVPRWLVEDFINKESNSNSPVEQGEPVEVEEPKGFAYLGDTYTPHNNKLYNSDYNYMILSATSGDQQEIHYENFLNRKVSFSISGQLSDNPAIMCIPCNYFNQVRDYTHRVMLTDFPQSSYGYSSFLNSQSFYPNSYYDTMINKTAAQRSNEDYNRNMDYFQSMVNNGVSAVGGVAGAVGSAASGNVGGAISSGVQVFGSLANMGFDSVRYQNNTAYAKRMRVFDDSLAIQQIQANARAPYALTGTATSNIMYAFQQFRINCYQYQIKPYYAKIIDSYFDMYGYTINQYGIPDPTIRTKWTYIQTGDAPVRGAIPHESLMAITEQLQNGLRFWRNPAACWLDYSQDNTIGVVKDD